MAKVENWDSVDMTLKRLAEIEVGIEKINGDTTVKVNQIKEMAKQKAKPLCAEKDTLEKQITLFCEQNKHEFMQKRSKQFNFGEVGYKVVKTVSIPKDKNRVEALLKTVKALGFNDCIAYKEELNRDKLNELDEVSFAKLGIKRKVEDNFRIVPSIQKLEMEK